MNRIKITPKKYNYNPDIGNPMTLVNVNSDDIGFEFLGQVRIPNCLVKDGTPIIDLESFSGTVVETVYMEHFNGGIGNLTEYSSIEEYWNDPVVKENVFEYFKDDFEYTLSGRGTPIAIDKITKFTIDGIDEIYSVSVHLWDDQCKPPQAWYNEFNSDIISKMRKLPTHDDSTAAIAEFSVKEVLDLFGIRYFPVLKAPIELKEEMIDAASWAKGYSEPLTDDQFVYIGVRAKASELEKVITEVYKNGGAILKQMEWEW